MKLTDIDIGKETYINDIHGEPAVIRRLGDMGMVKGVAVTPVMNSVLGGIRAYSVCGGVIAVRNTDARKISVEHREK